MERSKASRFADVDVYLHQMTYSFIRNPKVNIALQDAYAISSGRLKRCLSRAIEELQYGMGERVYEDALKIVEEEYDCSRIRTLHKFLVSVEERVDDTQEQWKSFWRILTDGLIMYISISRR